MSPALDLKQAPTSGRTTTTNGHGATNGVVKKTPTDGFGTRAIHIGSDPDPTTGAVIPALSLSTTYAQSSPGAHKGFEYSRSDNPNRRALEQLLSSIEAGGREALAFASGSAATGVVVQALGRGAHVLSVNDVYGGTHRYLKRVASEIQGVEVTFLDLENVEAAEIRDAIREDTKLIWLESPTNPTLKLMDIQRIAAIARSHPSHPLLLVDNTFLSPFYSSPLLLGADLVVHSLTKYVNGHSDVVMGAVIFPAPATPAHAAFAEKLRFLQNATGAVPSAFDCWLAQRGAKTLGLRMKQHGLGALRVARALRAHHVVREVMYPGLEGDRRYDLAWKSLSSHARKWIEEDVIKREEGERDGAVVAPEGGFPFSGMISFRLPSYTHAVEFLTSTRLFTLAESLGGVESLAEHPASMTHGGIAEVERQALGIDGGLVRLSVGVEETEDLVRDIVQALDKVARLV